MENEISSLIIGAAIEVHRTLGPGLLEGVYESCLCHELALRNIKFETQLSVPIKYKGYSLNNPLILDMIVEKLVIVEIKATTTHHSVYESQLLTYLKMMDRKLGLVINFGQSQLRDGIYRVINGIL